MKLVNICKLMALVLLAVVVSAYLAHFDILPCDLHINSMFYKIHLALLIAIAGRYIRIGFGIRTTIYTSDLVKHLAIFAALFYLPTPDYPYKQTICLIANISLFPLIIGLFLSESQSLNARIKQVIEEEFDHEMVKPTQEQMLEELSHSRADITREELKCFSSYFVELFLNCRISIKYIKAEIHDDHLLYTIKLIGEIDNLKLDRIKEYINQYYIVTINSENRYQVAVRIPFASTLDN